MRALSATAANCACACPRPACRTWKATSGHALQATGRRSIPTTLIGAELLDRGVTAQLAALHAHCQRTQTGTDRDCHMLDPAVQLRRVGPGPRFEAVPTPAGASDTTAGASSL